ncbi:agmatine deiminase [Oribacterium sp. WCC10]|uniref:agmatine deiminase n=1 Tax=Oribacterium sp. WCC10 TaxID=1855343 RepID=UPI0008E20B2A|nr:agmatine deiminase [Oribacterium sp. WCC10]SFG23766.1 agmatine deiminase [Oribacterium sp. WCC10]
MLIKDHIPSEDGFYMPAEYVPHEGTLLVWPTRPGSWGINTDKAQDSFISIAKALSPHEKVFFLCDKAHLSDARNKLKGIAEVLEIPTDDAWARDIGPTFVTNGNEIRGINWRFNAWGGNVDGLYAEWDHDDAAAEAFCDAIGRDIYDFGDFVLEGGSIHTDGEGTLLVTESCLLSRGRNPSLTKHEIEKRLMEALSVKKILWLPHGIYNDETNEHVDNVCAFIRPAEVVLAWTDDINDPQYEMSEKDLKYLSRVTDAKGRKIRIHKLPIPDHPVLVTDEDLLNYEFEEGEDYRESGERLAASYVNFYFGNGTVLVPQFGGDNESSDRRALEILRELCPDRKVIGIDSLPVLKGGGNIHCITQQIPKP